MTVRVGLLGTDSSHAIGFTALLNGSAGDAPQVGGGRVVAAWPGTPSPDFAPSRDRIRTITSRLRDDPVDPITMADSPETLADRVDAIVITAADPRVHPALFHRIVAAGKPVLIDKTLATGVDAAEAVLAAAGRHRVPLLCASPHRFAPHLIEAVRDSGPAIDGVETTGRMPNEPGVPAIFWYGVHLVEMAYAVLGPGCRSVQVRPRARAEDGATDLDIHAEWRGGRTAALHGRSGPGVGWSVTVDAGGHLRTVPPPDDPSTVHAALLTRLLAMAGGAPSPVGHDELLEVVRFMTAVERSRISGAKEAL